MVQGNHHDIVVAGQVRAVIADELLSRALAKTAAMEPDHHRTLLAVIDAAGPYVHAEAVLVVETVVPMHREGLVVGPPAGTGARRRRRPVGPAGADVRPRIGIHGGSKAFGLGIGNPLIDIHSVVNVAGHGTGHRLDSRQSGGSFEHAGKLRGPAVLLYARDSEHRGEEDSKVRSQCHGNRFCSVQRSAIST